MDQECENCTIADVELVRIRRVYLTPETWDVPASRQMLDEAELWCISCLSQYPHELAADPTGDPGGTPSPRPR